HPEDDGYPVLPFAVGEFLDGRHPLLLASRPLAALRDLRPVARACTLNAGVFAPAHAADPVASVLPVIGGLGRLAAPRSSTNRCSSEYHGGAKPNPCAASSWRT